MRPDRRLALIRTCVGYAAALAGGATLLNWLQYRYLARALSGDLYLALLAAGFILLGIWLGARLTPRSSDRGFKRNEAAIRALALSPREIEILEALVSGDTNKELARRLGISPNTVKTHVARIYEKLQVERRVQAIEQARLLALIP